jgi:predicted phage terminase large subunit-like protein
MELAERFGRRVRNLINEHSSTLDVTLAPDIQAAGQWETTAGGEYFAAGVLGAITGRRSDLVLIDDPVKSRAEADSETVRERVWEWWKADLLTRLKPGAKIVLVQTRWHEDDLGGRLLAEMASGGRHWEVLKLPMEAELHDPLGRAPGELLWPEWFRPDMVAEAKRDSRTWSALYQQRPSPATGTYFERDWLRPANSIPRREDMRVYGGSDYAVTSNGGDWTVHVVVGVDPDSRLWLLDLWRGQASSDQWIEAFCDLVHQWRPIGWAEEQGQIKAGVGPFLERRMRDRRAFVARRPFPTRGDKSVRAQSIRGRVALDGLHYDAAAPWRAEFEIELMNFPAGKHDDQVDALGLVGQLLDVMVPGQKPKPAARPPQDSWDRAFARSAQEGAPDGWRVA